MAKNEDKKIMLEKKIFILQKRMAEAWNEGDEDLYDDYENQLDKAKKKLENLIN